MTDISRTRHKRRNLRGSGLLAVLAVILVVSLFAAAGFWQLRRAHYKEQLQARTDAAMKNAPIELPGTKVRAGDVEFRSIHVRGEWLPDRTIFIDNKIQDGVVGYYVVTPLKIVPGNLHVLVNRGWVAAPPLRSELPGVESPSGAVDINGIARAPTSRFIELSKQSSEGEQGRVWQNLTIERFEAWSGLALQPVVIFQQDASDGSLQRVSVAPEASGLNADRHRGYALTWFGLAIVTLILAIAAQHKSKSKNHE
jgi:surfeit locus 1 family protein